MTNQSLDDDREYFRRMGATFRWLINDLKRSQLAGAQDLGVEPQLIEEVVSGRRPIPGDLLRKAVQIWPVNERDFLPIHDDLPNGVHVMRCAESRRSSRVLSRQGSPYYEYRDTAMTRLALLRPEWIKLLRTVDDTDPQNHAIAWNHGHFLYQLTFFVGDCNYYYEWKGQKYCVMVTTGDSVFGLPFVKHTFASRNPQALGHILALTFGNRLGGDVRQELAALGERAALAAVTQTTTSGALIALHMANGGYSLDFLAAESGVSRGSIERAIHDAETMNAADLGAIANAMRISVRDLLTSQSDTSDGIVLVRAKDARCWCLPVGVQPRYRLTELAGSRITPHTKAIVLEILSGTAPRHTLSVGLYQYGYNHSPVPVVLGWHVDGNENTTVLEPEDSFIMKPDIPHWFERLECTNENARILLLRTAGRIAGDAAIEASMIGQESMLRIVGEIACWYEEE